LLVVFFIAWKRLFRKGLQLFRCAAAFSWQLSGGSGRELSAADLLTVQIGLLGPAVAANGNDYQWTIDGDRRRLYDPF
jgi:hypothetical protein